MAWIWRHAAMGLMLIQAAYADPQGSGATSRGAADAGASGEGWACRKLHGGMSSQPRRNADGSWTAGPRGDAGTVIGVLVLWPVLAGACLASRG